MKRRSIELDLHGVQHDDVNTKLEDFFFWKGNPQGSVITGNSKKMKELVIQWLEENDFHYYIPTSNLGRIEVQDNLL
jgi:hypothetical protein